ncbi:hypothetical protein CC2G_004765 [Coprinopsis cinerea AmutBmut pab1-1]|nr:hypothetical protein CC2G_004765 [Coprinopsis cinerea AmutBmut pab1-1]
MTSYNVFCFFQHLRYTAFVPIEPDVDTVSSTDSDESQPGQDAHELEEKGEIVQEPRTPPATHTRQRHNEHFRTDSTSSNGSLDAKESDPALGRYKHSRSRSSKSKGPLKTLEKKVNKTKRLLRDRITWRDGLAETFNLYAQNLPNVLVLLPRAGLALGLILAFNPVWTDGSTGSIGSAINRDATFFRRDNGLLTSYALGVLWANVAWTAWRVLVLLGSWIGLWVLSGHGCAGICGPRDKWEEEEHNRLSAAFSATSSLASNDDSVLPWEWRECTRARVQDAWEFCLVGVGSGRYKWGADLYNAATGAQAFEKSGRVDEKRRAGGDDEEGGLSDEGLQRVLAAVGFPSVPTPAKRGVLSQDLFESPSKNRGASSDLERAEMIGEQRDLQRSGSGPLLKLPYPFTQPGSGQVSSNDLVPFPKEKDRESGKSKSSKTKSGSKKSRSGTGSGSSGSGSGSTSGSGNEGGLEGEGHEDEEEDDEDEDSSSHRYSEEPSTESSMGGRASNSMSSLGHPIPPTLGLTSVARSMSTYSPSPRQQRPGQASPHSGSSSSPLSWRSDVGNGGNTRFPFLSGPPVPSYIHRHRGVAVHTTGSSTGHSRGLSQVSGISGLSALSAGSGYAASGSAGAGMSEEGALSEMGEIIRENRQRDRNSSGESGGSAGSSGSGGLPMPPRHPLVGQEGRTRRRSTVQSSASGSSSASAPSPLSSNNSSSRAVATAAVAERQSEGVAFPSVSEREGRDRRRRRIEHTFGGTTPPNAEDLELGLGALSHESAMRAIRGRSRRLGEDDGESLQLSLRDDEHEHAARRERDEEDVYEDEDEESEVEGEREDVVGLLGSGSGNNSRGPSPRASLIGIQQGQGSDTNVAGSRSRTRSRHSSSAKSRESLRHSGAGRPLSLSLVSGGERSRHSSFHRQGYSVAPDSPVRARSRRESVASAVRERAGSFSVRIRQRAHSLMQSIAGGIATSPSSSVPASPLRGGEGSTSMTNLHAGGGHRRLGSSSGESALENFVTGTASARMPEVVRLPSQATPEAAAPAMRTVSGQSGASQETGESSGSGSGSSGVHPRHQQLIEEGYYSSSGHSRSGSESLSHGSAAEANYTFGRPVPFLQPRSQDQLSTHEEDPSAQPRSAPALVGTSEDDEEDDDEDQQFFSQEPSLRSPTLPARSRAGSATPSVLSDASGMITPMPHQMTFEAQQAHPALDDSPREVFLHPPASAWERHRSLAPGGASSDYLSVNTREGVESVMMLSSAAQSFVTAPVSIAESGTTTTTGRSGSSNDTNTISGSWEERRGFAGLFRGRPALLPQRGRRDSGMVERAGDVVGAGGGIGDGRIA